MTKFSRLVFILASIVLFQLFQYDSAALDNGLALTPPMGWNSWNCFGGNIDEDKIKAIADEIVTSGLKEAGYIYVNLDDGWMAAARDSSGRLQPDPVKFSGGIKALADYIHSKGLKFGIYEDVGTRTCMGLPGSYGYYTRDIAAFAAWGVDYVKFDWCSVPCGLSAQSAYTQIRDAIAACGRPMLFSICEWGTSLPWSWAQDVGNSWRTASDIQDAWSSVCNIIALNKGLDPYAGPGHWNDPDMLEVGNTGLSEAEARSHMSMWCMLAAPLILGNDARNMSQAVKGILNNPEVIAVDQDIYGKAGWEVWGNDAVAVWVRPLIDGSKAVALLNKGNRQQSITAYWADIGLKPGTAAAVRNLWSRTDAGIFTDNYSAIVPPHGCDLLKITGTDIGYVYASDYKWIYKGNGYGVPKKDLSNEEGKQAQGKVLTLNGRTYAKGIGVHAYSEIRFQLCGNFSRFVSDIGIDDECGENGSVEFQVWADGVKTYDSGKMTGKSKTKSVTVDVTGRNEVRLVVRDAEDGSAFDHANWADARFIR